MGLQVLPPVVLTVRELLEARFYPGGRRRGRGVGEKATLNLVAIQQKQLLALEAEVVEKQRALQENMTRLKLMTTPLLQAWAELTSEPHSVASAGGPMPVTLGRFYMRLFQNKNLVCWSDALEAARNDPPAKVIDLLLPYLPTYLLT